MKNKTTQTTTDNVNTDNATNEKRGPGRPKGSKNKSTTKGTTLVSLSALVAKFGENIEVPVSTSWIRKQADEAAQAAIQQFEDSLKAESADVSDSDSESKESKEDVEIAEEAV
jgi:hypothetical protein